MKWAKDLVTMGRRAPALLLSLAFRREQLPGLWRETVLALGPVYIKLAQVLSTRTDLLAHEYLEEFSRLRDQVQPEERATIEGVLRAAYPDGLERVFGEFNWEPIGSGCVCQVHEARLRDGSRVAVKILRPGVAERVAATFALLKAAARGATLLSAQVRTIDVVAILEELEALLLSQTDLRRELENLESFRRASAHDEFIVAPGVYPALSSRSVLVMEFVDSMIKPYDFRELGIDPKRLAKTVDNLQDVMIFNHGVCHADLHPGNFFWSRDGKLVLVDFGMLHELPLIERNHLLTFYLSIVDGFYEYAASYFLRHFVVGSGSEGARRRAEEAVLSLMRRHWEESRGRPQFSEMFAELLTVLARYDLKLRANLSPIFLTLITLEGYLYALDPSFDMLENVRSKRLTASEYTAIPDEAEDLILGEFGTYSTALFEGASSPREAYARRDAYILERLAVGASDYVYDVGCGRGALLEALRARGVDGLGITVSRHEQEACLKRGLTALWTSWEESDRHLEAYPRASAMTAVEMLFHLASLHENKEGLLDLRLARFFRWAHARLLPGGRLFLQTLNIEDEFLHSERHRETYERVYRTLPWMGFTTVRQIKEAAGAHFDLIELSDHSADLLKTYVFWRENMDANAERLRALIKPRTLSLLRRELAMVMELSERGSLSLHRSLWVRKG